MPRRKTGGEPRDWEPAPLRVLLTRTLIDEEDLKKKTKIQGEGTKLTSKDKGSYAYRIHGLQDGTMYYFNIRAANRVGWSDWSEVSRFMTKNSKPAKLREISASACSCREITVSWTPPESHGVEFLRFARGPGGPGRPVEKRPAEGREAQPVSPFGLLRAQRREDLIGGPNRSLVRWCQAKVIDLSWFTHG
eukprot:Skav218686  [mRNA]  locus=scaffold4775:17754:27058:+ [translate_table: standard]